jgi:YHS domain-containing protein
MSSFRLVALIALCAIPNFACETARDVRHSSADHAICPVCNAEGDLACLDVKIDERTPRCEWNGTVYYFCSDDCRARFVRDPNEFLMRDH